MFLPVPQCQKQNIIFNLSAVSNKCEGKLSFLNLYLHI
jgi:hypothetical protein